MQGLLTHKKNNGGKMNIQEKVKAIKQSRSKYQIEKFVIGQHHSPEMQYYQLCLEVESVFNSIAETELRIRKVKAEAEELKATGKESDAIEAEIKLLSIENLEAHLIGSKRELAIFEELFEQYPEYTREDIEEAQQEYWETRLTRVAQLQMLSRQGGVDWAQLEAVWQAGIMEKALVEIPTMNKLVSELEFVDLSNSQEN
jgi:hypothetical protein